MKIFNIDNNNITINGNIYCSNDIEFSTDSIIDLTYDTIQYDFHIKGNLYIICDRMFLIGNTDILNNCTSHQMVLSNIAARTIDPKLRFMYDKDDFRVIKADKVYVKCPNLKVGKDIYAFYGSIEDELRSLKLKKMKSFYVHN